MDEVADDLRSAAPPLLLLLFRKMD